MTVKGNIYLIPNVISEDTQDTVIPTMVLDQIKHIKYFLAEDIRTARRYLSSLKIYGSIEELQFDVLNKSTKEAELASLLSPIFDGNDVGIISESGCPGIADPGALAVGFAHNNEIKVTPLVGPSSLLLALMGSGLNGQCFAFQGYLPIKAQEASQKIKDFEKESKKKNQTQIFIETPYRNNQLFTNLLKTLMPHTQLCVALDLTGKDERIITLTVKEWRKSKPEWPKTPAVFLFLAN